MLPNLSPYGPLAVGGGSFTQKPTVTCCPRPVGLGATWMKELVKICHGGECALAFGSIAIDVPIEIVKIAAIKIAIVLFFNFCIFSSFL
jgi:hypothetical protein